MPLYLTSTHSSRVSKTRRPPDLSRSSSLPFGSSKRTKTLKRAQSAADALTEEEHEDDGNDKDLDGPGKTVTVVPKPTIRDLLSAVQDARSTMFDPLPSRAGMNSVRIAEVLNFQRYLPPVVTIAHIHALRSASSRTEKDIQSLLSCNQIRRLRLTGRGNDISGLSELILLTEEYATAVRKSGLAEDIASVFLNALSLYPKSYTLLAQSLPRPCVDALFGHGFLVASNLQRSKAGPLYRAESIVMPATISRSASGSQAAVGGEAAFETLGGVNGARRSSVPVGAEYILSIPGLGAYISLVEAGRAHFLELLRQFSKHRQAPLYLMRERWNGNVDSNENQVSVAKRIRGEFSNVLPANTKKWKVLKGLSFDWVMEECLGAGLIELFETYSVGLGVRALV